MTAIRSTAAGRVRGAAAGLDRVSIALLALMVVLDAAYVVGLVIVDGADEPVVTVILALATQWVPVSVFWLAAARVAAQRLPVILAALAVTMSALGDTYFTFGLAPDADLAEPSLADPAYLVFYPLMIAALVLLVRRQLRGVGRLVLVETAVATTGAGAVLAVILAPVIAEQAAAGDSAIDRAIAVSYPIFDLLLLAVMAGIASVPTVRLGRRWGALLAGLAVFAAADVVYALMVASDSYVAGTPFDATWAIALALVTWWVTGISADDDQQHRVGYRAPLVTLPAVAVLASLTVLVLGTAMPVSALAVVLAATTVGLAAVPIVFRQAMLGRMLAAQREAVRRLTELDREKSDLLATVNHEFRTPLTSINGHVELLTDGAAGELPAAALEMLRTIERNGARLQSLIDETFAASRLDRETVPLVVAPLDIGEVVARAIADVAPRAATAALDLITTSADPGAVALGDAAQLRRALVELLENAVKFTPAGGRITVGVEATRRDVSIHVVDTGLGIPSDDVGRLFTRFFRASNVQRAAIPGVGLGLSIAQQIVVAQGGRMTVDTAVGRGTEMTITLPRARRRDRVAAAAMADRTSANPA